jgi:hypothetical protein
MFWRNLAGLTVAASCIECSTSADKVAAAYISPLQYQQYSCQQLGEEAQRVSVRVAQLSGAQDQKVTDDAIATTAAVIIFWPAAFLVGGDDQTTAELSRLKGEFETIERVAIQNNCGLQIRRAPPPSPKPVRHQTSYDPDLQ